MRQNNITRLGLIGAGHNGAWNMRQFAALPDRCKIVAIADPNREAATKLATELSARATDDFHELFDCVDAVIISSPNFLHAEQSIACAEAGLHLWIEKPMALNSRDALAITQAVERHKVHSFVGFSVRFDPAIMRMMELYRQNAVGKAVSLWSRRLSFWPLESIQGWRGRHELCGGIIHELLTHELDWIVELVGLPKTVFCKTVARIKDHSDANEHAWLTLGYESGLCATLEGSQMAMINEYYRGVIGETGSLYTQSWGQTLVLQTHPKECAEQRELPQFNKHALFLDILEGKSEPVCPASHTFNIVRLAEAALQSAALGQPVSL